MRFARGRGRALRGVCVWEEGAPPGMDMMDTRGGRYVQAAAGQQAAGVLQ